MSAVFLTFLVSVTLFKQSNTGNPCCSFPCLNGGVCLTTGFNSYTCDCTRLGYEGDHCESATTMQRRENLLKFVRGDTLDHILNNYDLIWKQANKVTSIRESFMRILVRGINLLIPNPPLYESYHEYATLEVIQDRSLYARTLPPVPKDCPRPLGVKGNPTLPDPDQLFEELFKRDQFIPEPVGMSVLLATFGQHFTHQVFWTDFSRGGGYTKGSHTADASQIYGNTKDIENALRSFDDGKMKSQMIDGEEYPPYLRDVLVPMRYPVNASEDSKFALGHEFFGIVPSLFVLSTIWIREHNRVCEILKSEHPEFDDERLFYTAKLIIIGEMEKIVVEEYFSTLSNYGYDYVFKPEVLYEENLQYRTYVNLEFNLLYHFHPFMPSEYNFGGEVISAQDFLFNTGLVFKVGFANFIDALSRTNVGKMTHHNHGPTTEAAFINTVRLGRELRLQSLNEYRKKVGMEPHRSFEELTGDETVAKQVEALYGDIDAVEFYSGMFLEKHSEDSAFGPTMAILLGAYSLPGLMSNPITSPGIWKPSTFGGETGFNIVKTATATKLFCQNINGPCPLVSMRVPKK